MYTHIRRALQAFFENFRKKDSGGSAFLSAVQKLDGQADFWTA